MKGTELPRSVGRLLGSLRRERRWEVLEHLWRIWFTVTVREE